MIVHWKFIKHLDYLCIIFAHWARLTKRHCIISSTSLYLYLLTLTMIHIPEGVVYLVYTDDKIDIATYAGLCSASPFVQEHRVVTLSNWLHKHSPITQAELWKFRLLDEFSRNFWSRCCHCPSSWDRLS